MLSFKDTVTQALLRRVPQATNVQVMEDPECYDGSADLVFRLLDPSNFDPSVISDLGSISALEILDHPVEGKVYSLPLHPNVEEVIENEGLLALAKWVAEPF